MNITNYRPKRDSKIGVLSLVLLIINVFFGFIFTKTIFASTLLVTVSFLFLLVLFLLFTISNIHSLNRTKYSSLCIVWIPFLLYTIFGYLLSRGLERFSFWTIALLIIILANNVGFNYLFPKKMIVFFGAFLVFGVFFQFLFPDFYNQHIAPFFLNGNTIIMWSQASGYAGFTYQLGNTAELIIISEVVLLFCPTVFRKRKIVRFLLLVSFMVAIFLTGKRTLSVLSVGIPILTYFFSIRKRHKRFFVGILLLVLTLGFYFYFSKNAVYLSSTTLFGRIAKSFISYQAGNDISAERSGLSAAAIDLWKLSPIFGIGISKFINYSHLSTDVHNAYLQTLCEQGIIGFLLFVFPLAFVLIRTILLIRKNKNAVDLGYLKISLSLQLIYIIDAFTENKNVNTHGYLIYFIAVAIAISVDKQILLASANASMDSLVSKKKLR